MRLDRALLSLQTGNPRWWLRELVPNIQWQVVLWKLFDPKTGKKCHFEHCLGFFRVIDCPPPPVLEVDPLFDSKG